MYGLTIMLHACLWMCIVLRHPYSTSAPTEDKKNKKINKGEDDDRVRFHFNSNTARVLIHVSNWNQSRFSSCLLLLLSSNQRRAGWHMNKTGNLIRLLIEHISYFCPSFPPILHRPLDLTRQQRHLHLTDKQAIDFFVWGLSPTHFPPLIK